MENEKSSTLVLIPLLDEDTIENEVIKAKEIIQKINFSILFFTIIAIFFRFID